MPMADWQPKRINLKDSKPAILPGQRNPDIDSFNTKLRNGSQNVIP